MGFKLDEEDEKGSLKATNQAVLDFPSSEKFYYLAHRSEVTSNAILSFPRNATSARTPASLDEKS